MELSAQKRRVRLEMLARRRGVPPEAAARAALAAARHLLAEPRVLAARRVALYAATPDELSTRPLFDALGEEAIRLLPRCAADGRLEFARVSRWEELRPGRYGLLEPPPEAPRLEPTAGDAVLVPGVAFDPAGHRVGRGSGSYDRHFAAGSGDAPLLIGLGYALQVLPSVPHGPRDRRMDAIATEEGVRWIEGEAV